MNDHSRKSLDGKPVALIAGGSGGIGSAIAERLAEDGLFVAIGYRSNPERADEVLQRVRSAGGDGEVLRLDLQTTESTAASVRTLLNERHRIDAVIYAAGPYIPQQWISKVDSQTLLEMLSSDTMGCFNLVSATLSALRNSGGSVVALSTSAVRRHVPKDALSSLPKAAIESLIRAVASEEGRFGVRANAVAVGLIEAGMFYELRDRGDFSDAYVEAALASIPLGRMGQAADIADTVGFLASERARYVTGQVIAVDGGLSV